MCDAKERVSNPDVGMLCAQLLFAFQHDLHTEVEKPPGTKSRHGAVMAYLDWEGSRATDLAERSGQHKQVIGSLVDELVELGIVERQPDPCDRRAKLIVPTEYGRAHMQHSRAAAAAIERRYAEYIGEQRYAEFKRTLNELLTQIAAERP